MKVSIFDLASGRILRCVDCPEEFVAMQFDPATQATIQGEFPDDKYYVAAGVPILIPTRPTSNHVFDFTTKTWVDPRTLADVKVAKNAAIDRARDRRAHV